ncbi:MAG: phosphate acyltransferase PlsX [Actinobacteria bacterium]|uniref:phosphate acyltransferase n=1 Tax=freshwater metagenome TaxID=449393 RepID=A0A6J7D8X9_9ZZZZ|nr:phosphate acyltransferase PlsX [Actinomycetota bacterium]
MARVALDLLGGDGAPEVVADAVGILTREDVDIDLVLVGPPDLAEALLAARGIHRGRLEVCAAHDVVPMDARPLDALRADASRAHPRMSVMVAAMAVRDGKADAWVSVGHTGASVTAAALVLGRIAGMTRPALAVVLPGLEGPVVLVDAGASLDASPEALAQFAVAGWGYARGLGVQRPQVGLLNIGHEPGKGDELRLRAFAELSARLPLMGIDFVGNVEGSDVARGAAAQVIVTDGFTGNVLLKGIEGAVDWAAQRMGTAYGDLGPARAVVRAVGTGDFAGGMLLGVNGITVVGHGAGNAAQICACVRLAARSVDAGTLDLTREAVSALGAEESGPPPAVERVGP